MSVSPIIEGPEFRARFDALDEEGQAALMAEVTGSESTGRFLAALMSGRSTGDLSVLGA